MVVWAEPPELLEEPVDVNPESVEELLLVVVVVVVVVALSAVPASTAAIPPVASAAAAIAPAMTRRALDTAGVLVIWSLPVSGRPPPSAPIPGAGCAQATAALVTSDEQPVNPKHGDGSREPGDGSCERGDGSFPVHPFPLVGGLNRKGNRPREPEWGQTLRTGKEPFP